MEQLCCCCCCSNSSSSSFWGVGVADKGKVHHGGGKQQQQQFVFVSFGNDSKISNLQKLKGKGKGKVKVRAGALEKRKRERESGTGGKMMVELVGAFNRLTERMEAPASRSSSRILFMALKLSLPLLHALPQPSSGRSPLSKALSVALLLADHLRMDAEVISAALLRPAVEGGAISIPQVASRLGTPTAHLLHESFRVSNSTSNLPFILDVLDDDDAASALRKFCLTYYDIRAVILEQIGCGIGDAEAFVDEMCSWSAQAAGNLGD